MKKITLMSIFVFLMSFPSVLADNYTHTVTSDLTAFIQAFRYLFDLNSSGVAANLVRAAPLIGLIAVVYGLTYFICVTTLFKENDHHKYGRIIAIGIAVLGLAQQNVYNAILAWSSTFLISTFVVAVIFMFIIFLNKSRTTNYDSTKLMREAQIADLGAKKALLKVKHDVSLDKKYYKRVDKDLSQLDSDINEISRLGGSERHQVDEIARLMQQLASAAQKGENGLVHQYAQALGNHIGALISSMKHEDVIDSNVNTVIERINTVLSHWAHDDMKDEKLEKQVLHIFKHVAARLGHNYDEKEYADLIAKNRNLSHHFHEMHRIINELASLRDHFDKQTESLDSLGYKKKHLEAAELRTAIFDSNYSRAHKHLDNLRAIIEQEPIVGNNLKHSSSQMRTLIGELESHESAVKTMVNSSLVTLAKTLSGDKEKEKAKGKIYLYYGQELKALLNALLGQLRQAAGAAHNAEVHFPQQDITRNKYGESISNKVTKIKITLAHSVEQSLNGYFQTVHEIFDSVKDNIKNKKSTSEDRLNLYKFLEHSDFNALYKELSQMGLGNEAPDLDKIIRHALGNLIALVHDLYQLVHHTKDDLVNWEENEAKDLTEAGIKTKHRDLKRES